MKMPVTEYVVMIHKRNVGTFAPAFPDMDTAEEFANAMRIITDDVSISEPVPVVAARDPIQLSSKTKAATN